MSAMSDNKNIDDYTFFLKELKKEVGNENPHFLRVSGISESFLEGAEPNQPLGTWSRKKSMPILLQAAIWEFYNEFDRKLFESFPNPQGVFTKCVWAKFRNFRRTWKTAHDAFIETQKERAKQKRNAERERAHVKRQEKERQQMLVMGGSNLELGRKKFVERMHIQKTQKLSNVNDVSLQLEEEFAAWLTTPEADSYTKPVVDSSPKQFRRDQTYGTGTTITNINLRVKSVKSVDGVVDALRQLSEHPSADTLTIHATLTWDEKVAFSNPHTHTFTGGTVLVLNNSGRVGQNDTMRVIGFVNQGSKSYIVTPKTSNAYRLFPKRFEKLESRNKKISSRMNILYNVDQCLSSLMVSRLHLGVKYVMTINILYNGKDRIDAREIFKSHVIRDLQKESQQALDRNRREKAERDRRARRKGLSTQRKKEWSEERKYGHVDDAIKRGHVSTRKKVNFLVDNTDKIMGLCNMFEKGLLNESQFERAKEQLLG